MPTIFLTHIPDMLKNYYGERALAELRKLGDVRLNDTGQVLDAKALAQAAQGCEIIISDRQTAGPAEFFPLVDDLVAFLRRRDFQVLDQILVHDDIAAASAEGILVTEEAHQLAASCRCKGPPVPATELACRSTLKVSAMVTTSG
jgi:D-3-phosphoglycerate dehydrogenase / 2-oxoglutarate reductase